MKPTAPVSGPGPSRQRGAALLTAMIIVTLVATLAASMVWQQWRAVQVEAAERARAQSAWILSGALDWARLLLREDGKANKQATSLGDPWAQPLEEARLSTFLAADKDNNSDDGPDAFLSGYMVDAQSRYNLGNLTGLAGEELEKEQAVFVALCTTLGVSADVATRITEGFLAAHAADTPASGAAPSSGGAPSSGAAPLKPASVAQLAWLGVDPESLRLLEPYVVVLPEKTLVNANTAPREVLAALGSSDPGRADGVVESRKRTPMKDIDDLDKLMPGTKDAKPLRFTFKSNYFEVHGLLRWSDRILEERSLLFRAADNTTIVKSRERTSSRDRRGS